MLAVEKWAQNKHFLLALFAPQLASSSQEIHLLFKDLKQKKVLNQEFPLPDLPSWFALYRSHRKINRFIKDLFSGFSGFGSGSIALAEILIDIDQVKRELGKAENQQQLSQMTEEEKTTQVQKAIEAQKTMLTESFNDLESEIDGKAIPPAFREDFLSMFSSSTAGQFYLFVAVPCWLLYRDSATRLYRRARQGDYDSLEKLLRLDPLLIHDPSIGRQVQQFRVKGKYLAYEALIESVLKKPRSKITRKKMKYAIAGIISGLGIAINQPLTEPEIRSLFDAIAQDARKIPIDNDLPESPEAFAKAIQRDRSYWNKIFQPDKKN